MYETVLWNQMLSHSRAPDEWFAFEDDAMRWLYRPTEEGLFEVGYYDPHKTWCWDSTHRERVSAAARVNFLNGGNG